MPMKASSSDGLSGAISATMGNSLMTRITLGTKEMRKRPMLWRCWRSSHYDEECNVSMPAIVVFYVADGRQSFF